MSVVLAALHLSTGKLLLLGFVAGFTIFFGLPMGRMRAPAVRLRVLLNAVAIGILLFLVYDVLSHANEPVESALDAAVHHSGSWLRFSGLAATFAAGLAAGLAGLAHYDSWMEERGRRAGARTLSSAAVAEEARLAQGGWSPAQRLAMMISVGIGLHNFSEGLAIGQSAAKGEISLALLLIIGFGLHNATEGFGIVAPLAAESERPSWSFLGLAGLIGGGPTFVGTLVGHSFVNDTLFLAFLALAAGSILYVVVQLLKVASRQNYPVLVCWGVLIGLLAGFATDYVLVAAGA